MDEKENDNVVAPVTDATDTTEEEKKEETPAETTEGETPSEGTGEETPAQAAE